MLILAMHHIVTDGWSIGVLFRELGVLYEAFSKGQASPLAPLPIQYPDFAVWQRQWLQGEALDRELEYWREQLERSSGTGASHGPAQAAGSELPGNAEKLHASRLSDAGA